MAKLGPTGKMRRVLEFLLGLRDERILAALTAHGFSDADRQQGWTLLSALGMTQAVPVVAMGNNATLSALDAWRREWLGLVRASLSHSHPKICRLLFQDLDRTGSSSISVVPEFLARFAQLERTRDATSRSALAKLRERGFGIAHVKEAQRLVADLPRTPPPPARDLKTYRVAIREAEVALWDYYLEWSQLARAVIRDVRWLERLGYRGGQATEDEEPEFVGAVTASDAQPAAATASRAAKPKRGRTKIPPQAVR